MSDSEILLSNIDKLHTTELGEVRIRQNTGYEISSHGTIMDWCKALIQAPECKINRHGKNYYCTICGITFTINAYSYTVITAHRV